MEEMRLPIFGSKRDTEAMKSISTEAMDQLFTNARTHNGWLNQPVTEDSLHRIYDLFKWGPTSANGSPGRVVFVKSPEAKAKLLTCVAPGNIDKTREAPVTAIIAHDTEFYEQLPKLFPAADARSWFVGNQALIDVTAFRNSSIQGAYFILAARALGLDCGPMSGFDNAKLDAAFFAGTKWKSNFICNLGYGDESKLYPRGPRLSFDEACKIV
jgi:3-hydroxypropanoate dehydrogenase